MPYELSWEPRGFFAKYSGIVRADDILGVMTELEGSSRFDNLRYGISDYLEVCRHTVTAAELV